MRYSQELRNIRWPYHSHWQGLRGLVGAESAFTQIYIHLYGVFRNGALGNLRKDGHQAFAEKWSAAQCSSLFRQWLGHSPHFS